MGVPAAQMNRTAGGWEAVLRALDSALAEGDFPGGAAVVVVLVVLVSVVLTVEVAVVLEEEVAEAAVVSLAVVVAEAVVVSLDVVVVVVVLGVVVVLRVVIVVVGTSSRVNVRVGTTLAVWVRQRMASSNVTPTNWEVA